MYHLLGEPRCSFDDYAKALPEEMRFARGMDAGDEIQSAP